MKKLILVIVALISLSYGYSNLNTVSEGVIVDRTFIPAHEEDGIFPYSYWVPDAWTITVSGNNKLGVERQNIITVPEYTWQTLKVDDYLLNSDKF